jgi:nucleoside-triphosphatase THEP1
MQTSKVTDCVLPPASEEQQAIIDAIETEDTIIVDAVAGSGKTTLVFHIANTYSESPILQITYNNSLQAEVETKRCSLGIDNLKVSTYHALAGMYNETVCKDDILLQQVINGPSKIKTSYDIIIVDETQDMTRLLFQFVKYVIAHNSVVPVLILLGDKDQALYEFRGADNRFLTLGDKIFNRPAKRFPLSTSYRVTRQIAGFVNDKMLGYKKIKAIKDGPKVEYYRVGSYYGAHGVAAKILGIIQLLLLEGYTDDDIFVLTYSVNSTGPIKYIENLLSNAGLNIYMPNDQFEINKQAAAYKMCITTFHQSKGREKPVVIVLNFDESYFVYGARDLARDVCPNTMYVACTRATERLIVFQAVDAEFKFLREPMSTPHPDVTVAGEYQPIEKQFTRTNISPTYLTKHMSQDLVILLNEHIKLLFRQIVQPGKRIHMRSTAEFVNQGTDGEEFTTVEEISNLNGLVIPAMVEKMRSNGGDAAGSTMEEIVDAVIRDKHSVIRRPGSVFSRTYARKHKTDIARMLKYANLYCSICDKLLHKLHQIKTYGWMTQLIADTAADRLNRMIGESAVFEHMVAYEHPYGGLILNISGRLDCVDESDVWEFKCTNELTVEHFVQLLLYWIISPAKLQSAHTYKLANITTGEVWELLVDSADKLTLINEIFNLVLNDKYVKKNRVPDDVWLSLQSG